MFKPVEDSTNLFEVTHKFTVDVTDIDGIRHTVTVPKGYRFDGASIPKLFWSFVGNPFEADLVEAACVHDFYCDNATVYHDRVIGDNVFFALLARRKTISRFKAICLYSAVRLWTFLNFKHLPYRKQQEDNVTPPYREDEKDFD